MDQRHYQEQMGNQKVWDSQSITKDNSVLRTKLYPPPARKNLVMRRRLLNKLSLYPGHKLTLIAAPAGYGKTTLATEWLLESQSTYAWLSLDKGDNDLLRFMMHFIVALQQIDPSIGHTIQGIIGSPHLPQINTLMDILINDIAYIDKKFILIMDDYHVIKNDLIHGGIQYLLDNQPVNMHVIVLTRENPPFNLSRLRVRDQLIEIYEEDLSFNEEEIIIFLTKTMNLEVSQEIVKVLNRKTEGWIAGLQLAGLSLQRLDRKEQMDFVDHFDGSHRYMMDYLMNEVFQQLDTDLCLFLYHTSLLERFTVSLCNAVVDRNDSKEMIEYLEKANLFIIPLDEQGQWYRYHPLISDFLRSGLGEVEEEYVYLRASRWMEEEGLLFEAVQYGIASKNLKEMERLIEKAVDPTLLCGEFSLLMEWIEVLPEDVLLSNGGISTAKGWTLFLMGKIEQAYHHLLSIEHNENVQHNSKWRGRFLALSGALAALMGIQDALEKSKEAVDSIEDKDPLFLTQALGALGFSYSLLGNMPLSTQHYHKMMSIAQMHQFYIPAISGTFSSAIHLNGQGHRGEAKVLCEKMIDYYQGGEGIAKPTFLLHIPLGIIYYEEDDLENARKYLEYGIKICSQFNLLYLLGQGEWELAKLQYALGEKELAFKTLTEGKISAKAQKIPKVYSLLCAAEMDIYMREGNFEAPISWEKEMGLVPDMEIQPSLEPQYFTYARFLIGKGRLEDAIVLLDNLEISAKRGERFRSLMTLYILKAIVSKGMRHEKGMKNNLEKAINHASPERYLRRFIDEGEIVKKMLMEVRGISPQFIDEILSKFDSQKVNLPEEYESTELKTTYELLSERELEILHLISLGYTNGNIAKRLYITVGTVKWHITNIFSKLGVHRRTQAIFKAKELKLL